jgi:rod shape-determining protein MreD
MQAHETRAQTILLPVKPAFIAFTLVAAFLANLLPWSGWLLAIKPDFVALVLLYWCIQQPRRVGFTVAMLFGLAMDVADGSLFGQHALAYSMLAFAGIVLHRRVLSFTMKDQILHVIPLLLANDVIVLFIRTLAGGDFPGIAYFVGSLLAGALWVPICHLLKLPQIPKPDPDHV